MSRNKMVPPFDKMINTLFKAIKQLGGSGAIDGIYEK